MWTGIIQSLFWSTAACRRQFSSIWMTWVWQGGKDAKLPFLVADLCTKLIYAKPWAWAQGSGFWDLKLGLSILQAFIWAGLWLGLNRLGLVGSGLEAQPSTSPESSWYSSCPHVLPSQTYLLLALSISTINRQHPTHLHSPTLADHFRGNDTCLHGLWQVPAENLDIKGTCLRMATLVTTVTHHML